MGNVNCHIAWLVKMEDVKFVSKTSIMQMDNAWKPNKNWSSTDIDNTFGFSKSIFLYLEMPLYKNPYNVKEIFESLLYF